MLLTDPPHRGVGAGTILAGSHPSPAHRRAFLGLLLLVTCIAIAFDHILLNVTHIGAFATLPHVLVFGMAFYLVANDAAQGVIRPNTVTAIYAIVALLVLSLAGKDYAGIVATAASIIFAIKLFAVLIITRDIEIRKYRRWIDAFTTIHLVGFGLNILFTSRFHALQGLDLAYLDPARIIGFELNSNAYSFLSAALALYYIFVRRRYLVPAILLVSIILAGSRSALIVVFATTMYSAHFEGRLKGKTIQMMALGFALLGGAMFLGRTMETLQNIDQTANGQGYYIRFAMMMGGLKLALQNFPIGVGAGNFGSPLSIGSPAYQDAGISLFPGVVQGWGIFDSGIGGMMGEYGFLGTTVILALIYRAFRNARRGGTRRVNAIFMFGIVLMSLFFRSVTASYLYSFVFALLMLTIEDVLERRRPIRSPIKQIAKSSGGNHS